MRSSTVCYFLVPVLFAPLLAAGQSSSSSPSTTLRVNSDLVILDVVVADSHKSPVHHLTAADFTVLENGTPQPIKSFEEHSRGEPAQLPPMPKLDPGTFTNYSPAPPVGALNILLLDLLNTPLKDQAYARDQAVKYLKEAPAGTRMAIFTLTTRLHILQGFTSDPELLRSVLNKKSASNGSALLGQQTMSDTFSFGNTPGDATMVANMQQFEAQQESFQNQLRSIYTLDALNDLGRYLAQLPGRKNLIWFSGSFPINILPDGDSQNPFGVQADSEREFRETTDLLVRSQVAVYPIDARGLMSDATLDSSSGDGFSKKGSSDMKASRKAFEKTAGENSTMYKMADATGGEAFINTNGLKEAVAKAVESGSNYYTLTYSPLNHAKNGDYRKIQVKVAGRDMTLTYRRGYYADDPNSPYRGSGAKTDNSTPTTFNPVRNAMLRGGPDPTEIIFEANVRPASTDTETTLAPGNKGSAKLTGPYRRYSILYTADPRDINCSLTPDNVHHCTMEFVTFVYDEDGALLNSRTDGIKVDLPASRYAAVLHGGFQYKQEISVPAKGAYFLRLGIHDVSTDHVGAVEVPVSAVANLPPPTSNAPSKVPPK